MDCAKNKKLIMEAKAYTEVEKTLQEAKIGRSGLELARTAYQIRGKQPDLANSFLSTVIKEMEEKDEERKEKEASDEVGGDNRADPLERKDKTTNHGQEPNTSFEGAQDQMSGGPSSRNTQEDIPGLMPGLHPQIASQMQPQMAQHMPQLNLPQQLQQMQYTVKEALKPYIKEIERLQTDNKKLKEAFVELDKKVKETTTQKGAMSLNIPSGMVRETLDVPSVNVVTKQHESLEDIRFRIGSTDKYLSQSS